MTRCQVAGCDRPYHAKGYCPTHYVRWHRSGDPLALQTTGKGVARLFYEETVRSYHGDECLIWPFMRDGNGYGRMKHNGRMTFVHRRLCEDANGPPPSPEHEAAHSCNRGHHGCVAKTHVRWATHIENMGDSVAARRHDAGARYNVGPANGRAKLTAKDVKDIRSQKGTRKTNDLAAQYGVSRTTIYQIHSGQRWEKR